VQHVVAIVVKGYPRLSETFIAQEILSLQKSGLRYRIVSLRRPTDKKTHPIHGQITAAVDYLPEYLYEAPVRVMRAWLRVRKRPGYGAARGAFLRDLFRDLTPNRVRRFGQALVMAAELPDDVTWIYAHFLHTPASVARYCAEIRGLPWSCSAHAKDIWTSPEWEKAEKLAHMEWLVTCTRSNVDHLRGADVGRYLDGPAFGHREEDVDAARGRRAEIIQKDAVASGDRLAAELKDPGADVDGARIVDLLAVIDGDAGQDEVDAGMGLTVDEAADQHGPGRLDIGGEGDVVDVAQRVLVGKTDGYRRPEAETVARRQVDVVHGR